MTSKNSFNSNIYIHAFKDSLLQGLPISMIFFTTLIILIPASTAGIPNFSIFNLDYTHHQMLFRFFYGGVTSVIYGVIILLGLCLAVSEFKFMLNKRTSDAYFSIGISRKKHFLIRFSTGAILISFTISIPFFISLILNIMAFSDLGSTISMIRCLIYLCIGLIILSFTSFSITGLCCCLIGTLSEAIVFSSTILAAPSIIFYSINKLVSHLLLGNSFGITSSSSSDPISQNLLWKTAGFNPILFFYNSLKTYYTNSVRFDGYTLPYFNYISLICWVLIIAILVFISTLILYKRKAEIAGISGKNDFLGIICSGSISFLFFSIVVDLAQSINITAAIIIGIITFCLIYIVFQIILLWRLENLTKKLFPIIPLISLSIITTIIIITGGLGYSKRIPDLSDINSIEMTYVGSPNYLNSNVNGTSNGRNFYLSSSYKFNSLKDLKKITELHSKIIAEGKGSYTVNNTTFSATTVPYDIIIKYTLKNGTTLNRYYDRTTLYTMSQLLTLDNTDKVKNSISDTIIGKSNDNQTYWAPDAFKNGVIYISDSWYTNPLKIVMNDIKRKTLIEALQKDITKQTIDDRYFPSKSPLGMIMFTLSTDENSNVSFGYNMQNSVIYLTDSFTNTISFLKENNLYGYLTPTKNIESITIQRYDPYIGINKNIQPQSQYFMGYSSADSHQYIITKDFGKDFVIDDTDRINKLLPILRNDYFMSDGGYLVSCKIKDSNQYIYKFLPKKDTPLYIKNSVR